MKEKEQLPIGTDVEIINSHHQHIVVGDKGFVDAYFEGGYAITITKYYPSANIADIGGVETRTHYFKREQLKVIK